MTKIIINLFEIQRDKAVQSCTNLSKDSAMFVPQLNKAPIKGAYMLTHRRNYLIALSCMMS